MIFSPVCRDKRLTGQAHTKSRKNLKPRRRVSIYACVCMCVGVCVCEESGDVTMKFPEVGLHVEQVFRYSVNEGYFIGGNGVPNFLFDCDYFT